MHNISGKHIFIYILIHEEFMDFWYPSRCREHKRNQGGAWASLALSD